MQISLLDGTTLEAPDAKPIDIVAFERHFHMGAAALGADPHVEHALFLAWNALKRTGKVVLPFDAFLAEVDDFESEKVPLEEAQPASSEPSPE
jgi:hypothetical protein